MDLKGPENPLLPFHDIDCSIRWDISFDNFLWFWGPESGPKNTLKNLVYIILGHLAGRLNFV